MKYQDFLQFGKVQIHNMEIFRNIYEAASKECLNFRSKCPFSSVISAVLKKTDISGACVSDYINRMKERISYELAFEMYWEILSSEENAHEDKMTAVAFATLYLNETGLSSSPKSMSETFSKNRNAMMKEFKGNDPRYPFFHKYMKEEKYCQYKEALSIDSLQNCSNQKGIPNSDFFFYVEKHAQSIFQYNYFETGVTYTKYFEILKEYQSLHKNVDGQQVDFDTELSAFIMEKLYYATSFSKMMLEYVSQGYIGKTLPNVDTKLFSFTKLFDSHNISLIDYLLECRGQELSAFFQNDDALNKIYKEFRWYRSFLLPIIKNILFVIVEAQYKGDIALIKAKLKEYIEEECSNMGFIQQWGYRSLLDNTIRKIEEINKSFNDTLKKGKDQTDVSEDHKIKRTRQGILFPPVKTDRNNCKFSMEMSKLFFHHDVTSMMPTGIGYEEKAEPALVSLHNADLTLERMIWEEKDSIQHLYANHKW